MTCGDHAKCDRYASCAKADRLSHLVMTPVTGSDCGFFLPSVANGHIPGSGEAEAYLAVSYPEHGNGHSIPDL